MTIAQLFSLETCFVQIQIVWVNFACTKRLFNLSVEAIINVRQVRKIPFEEQTLSFFLSLGQGVYVFEERPKSVQEDIGEVYCPGEFCLNREKCESIGGYVTTPRSVYSCGKCGAWFFVHKVPFYVTRTRKDDKNRQNTLFLC